MYVRLWVIIPSDAFRKPLFVSMSRFPLLLLLLTAAGTFLLLGDLIFALGEVDFEFPVVVEPSSSSSFSELEEGSSAGRMRAKNEILRTKLQQFNYDLPLA